LEHLRLLLPSRALLGYGYAHLATGRLRPRAQVALHAAVLAAALVLMPFSLGTAAPPPDASPVGWLLVRLAVGVGLPFVAIAATAPMPQVWFSRTTHPHARDPYFLYAASNAGSLLALLGYPVLVETTLDLSEQVRFWSAGFAATAMTVLACGAAALRRAAPEPSAARSAEPLAPVRTSERLRWVALAFVPSALMLAVTTHITTDIASAPLFWVVPLAVYILTFVLAFARRPLLKRRALLLPQGWRWQSPASPASRRAERRRLARPARGLRPDGGGVPRRAGGAAAGGGARHGLLPAHLRGRRAGRAVQRAVGAGAVPDSPWSTRCCWSPRACCGRRPPPRRPPRLGSAGRSASICWCRPR
jgi:hypothetical protein